MSNSARLAFTSLSSRSTRVICSTMRLSHILVPEPDPEALTVGGMRCYIRPFARPGPDGIPSSIPHFPPTSHPLICAAATGMSPWQSAPQGGSNPVRLRWCPSLTPSSRRWCCRRAAHSNLPRPYPSGSPSLQSSLRHRRWWS
jgi:hypothetical protein